MSTATALDPTEAMAAAVSDAYDQLRQLVEKFAGRRDDPQLLDEVGTVRRRALGRYNRAKKKAEPPAATPTLSPAAVPTSAPAPAVTTPSPAPAVTTPAVVVPAAISTPAGSERVSVRLSEATERTPSSGRPQPTSSLLAPPPQQRGKHRTAERPPWWAHRPMPMRAHALIVALFVIGLATSIVTVNPIPSVAALALIVAVLGTAPRRFSRRSHRHAR